jgi:hypothetical protein
VRLLRGGSRYVSDLIATSNALRIGVLRAPHAHDASHVESVAPRPCPIAGAARAHGEQGAQHVLGVEAELAAEPAADVGSNEPQLVQRQSEAFAQRDEKTWINESFEAAKADVYVQPIGVGAGPFALTDNYKSAALSLAKQRVALAGARLANLLNAALK